MCVQSMCINIESLNLINFPALKSNHFETQSVCRIYDRSIFYMQTVLKHYYFEKILFGFLNPSECLLFMIIK